MSGSKDTSKNDFAFELAERNHLFPITQEPEIYILCDECSTPIYFGDYYFNVGYDCYCNDCMKDLFMRLADQ